MANRYSASLVLFVVLFNHLGWSGPADSVSADAASEPHAPFINSLESVDVIAEAKTLKALTAISKPTLQLSEIDMLWVRESAGGKFHFELNRAVACGEGQSRQYALVRQKTDAKYLSDLDGNYSWSRADLVEKPVTHDGGDPSQALVLERKPGVATLYRVRWASEPTTGSGQYHTLRDLFVLHLDDGR